MKIDAHHHLWDPARGDYGWMPKDDPVLSRLYTPEDLEPQLRAAGIDATVVVQAAPTVAETEYLLDLANRTPWIKGVVGWVDFENPGSLAVMQRLAGHPKFKGVRPMIQDLPEDAWMLGGGVQGAFRAICDLGLRFDALGFPRHIPHFQALLKRYPTMPVVLDHFLKPQIRHHPTGFQDWADGMARLADDSFACIKFSALITEDGPDWSVDRLRPHADHIFDRFGAERVMWGSDWPVCRLRGEYGDWHKAALTLTEDLSDIDRALIFGGTAAGFYGI